MSLFRPMFFTSWQIASFLNASFLNNSLRLQIPLQHWGMTWFLQRDWSTGQKHGCSVGFGIFETNTVALMILSWIKGSRFVTWSLWAVGNMESNDNDVEWCGHQFKQGFFRQYSILASNEVKCDSKTEKHWINTGSLLYMMTHKHNGMMQESLELQRLPIIPLQTFTGKTNKRNCN